MTKQTSKWKKDGDPKTDIGTLKYPYKVTHRDKVITTVATFEDAEAMLDRLVSVYITDDVLLEIFKSEGANWKLKEAFNKVRDHDATVERKEARREAKFQQREQDKARRLDIRIQDGLARWRSQKQIEFEAILEQAAAMADDILALQSTDDHLSPATLRTMQRLATEYGNMTGVLRNFHYGVTSSKMYAVHRDQTKSDK